MRSLLPLALLLALAACGPVHEARHLCSRPTRHIADMCRDLHVATRARRLTNNVLTLTQKADEISRGDLDEPVSLRSNDELDDLSAALERMRVSMSGALLSGVNARSEGSRWSILSGSFH